MQQQPQFVDNDGDGISSEDGDCNDLKTVSPYASEICDGIDNDCDGLIDDDDLNLSISTATTFMLMPIETDLAHPLQHWFAADNQLATSSIRRTVMI